VGYDRLGKKTIFKRKGNVKIIEMSTISNTEKKTISKKREQKDGIKKKHKKKINNNKKTKQIKLRFFCVEI